QTLRMSNQVQIPQQPAGNAGQAPAVPAPQAPPAQPPPAPVPAVQAQAQAIPAPQVAPAPAPVGQNAPLQAEANLPGDQLEAIKQKYDELKRTVESLTASSVESLLVKIRNLATRPSPEFNKYDALDLLEATKNAAHDSKHEKAGFYRVAYETLRGKMDQPDEQFRSFLLPLLGDKDHERGLAVSLPWEWEVEPNFDKELLNGNIPDEVEHWVDWMGRPYERAGNRVTVMPTEEIIHSTIKGDRLGDPSTLSFRDPETFVAGELHNHLEQWEAIADEIPTPEQLQVLRWIREKVSIFDYFRPFVGRFKGTQYNSVRPPFGTVS
ncbi:hypothetical protein QZH41_020462, partial [Actinostola sp. cb2023]